MSNSKPLDGLVVVAIEQAVAAPLCTSRLADAGARVIKVERDVGETARHYDTTVHGTSAYFVWLNRGKQSTVFDLKNADDMAVIRAMIDAADVLVSNLAPGAMDRLGLSAEILHKTNPRLIAVQITGYGQDTEAADMRAYDLLVQAESGVCSLTGTPAQACKVGVSVADIATGMTAHAAILEALIARGISGRGKAVEISMFDCLADWMNVPLLHYDYAGQTTDRHGLSHAIIYPYGPMSCVDGDVMLVVQNPAEWARFCSGVLKRPDLIEDDRSATNAQRVQNRAALDEILRPIFAALTKEQATAALVENDLAYGTVSDVSDVSAHPALRRISGAVGGKEFELAAPPLHVDADLKEVPELGQHTEAIRLEFSSL